MRSRVHILGPVYELVCEAGGHLRDAGVAIPGDYNPDDDPNIATLVKTLRALHAAFNNGKGGWVKAYQQNQPIVLADVWKELDEWLTWLHKAGDDSVTQAITADSPLWVLRIVTAFRDAHEAYACALAVVTEVMVGSTGTVPPAPEGQGPAVHSGP